MNKIGFKLAFMFSLTTLILLTILGSIIYFQERSNIITLNNTLSNQILNSQNSLISKWIKWKIDEVKKLAQESEITSMDTKTSIEYLKNYQTKNQMSWGYFSISDKNGNYISTIYNKTGSIANEEYFKKLLTDNEEYYISNPVKTGIDLPFFIIAVPVRNNLSTPIGILIETITLEELSSIVSDIKNGENGFGWIVDSNGVVIAYPSQSLVMTMNIQDSSKQGFKGLNEFGKKMLSNNNGEGEIILNTGVKTITFYSKIIFTPGWILCISIPKNQIDASVNKTIQTLIFWVALIMIIIILLSILFSRTIIKPLTGAVILLKNISQGEGDLTKRLPVKTKDEIGLLAEHFNDFVEKLQVIISKIKNVGNKSKDIGTVLASNSEEISATIQEISATMKSIEEKSDIYNNEINISLNSIIDIKNFLENVVKLIEVQSSSVTESSAAVEEMLASLKNITRIIDSKKQLSDSLTKIAKLGEDDMKKTTESINSISKSATVIMDMIKIINDISERTNLLAMNASIEAAHAGETGKGFAVVAGEIRKLAEATSSNSKNISITLKNILEKINTASEVSDKTGKSIQNLITGIVDVANSMTEMLSGIKEISSGSSQITESLSELIQVTDEVRTSSKDMDSRFEIIDKSMINITQLSNENLIGVEETTKGINEISIAMAELAKLGNENSENINVLESEISRFITNEKEKIQDKEINTNQDSLQ
jgi:methyl-accepting chemotaxis protein